MTLLERINLSGTTVIMATHDAGIVDQMKRRVIELISGQIVRDERRGGYQTQAIPVQAFASTAASPTRGSSAMRLGLILGEVANGLRRNVSMVISVVLVTFISLTFVGAAMLLQLQIGQMKGYWYDRAQVAVYMCTSVDTTGNCTQTEATQAQIDARRGAARSSPRSRRTSTSTSSRRTSRPTTTSSSSSRTARWPASSRPRRSTRASG